MRREYETRGYYETSAGVHLDGFVINTDGVIQFECVNPNYKVRLDPEILHAAAKSALKTAEHKN